MQLSQIHGFGAAGLCALTLLTGCASPGVPRPPSLHLPASVRDLAAQRVGDAVELHFTVPEETTDHQALEHKGVPLPLTAVVCRMQGAACQGIARMAVTPGQVVAATDTLPPALTVGVARALAYRVRVENAAGRDAGLSRDALSAAGAAPAALTGLAAVTVAQGVQLTWNAVPDAREPIRVEATGTAAAPGNRAAANGRATRGGSAAGSSPRLLQVLPAPHEPGGAIDSSPAVGASVSYRVYRQREIVVDGQALSLRGASAEVTVTRSADVFAPAAPLGLLALALVTENGGASVSLSWEPNSEPDVTGYFVYRATDTGGFVRVTASPVAGVSFQDTASTGLHPGTRVRYAVTAVDRAGNESARSSTTEVAPQP
ncbi:fibronectin type III domain-containing protein [Terriglobus sp.]|uniref:fibronectin type III domain-containing protein n=1 Tax=Terriglobus sp. TaxID=1889013 RepID=UPI003AFFF0BE